MTQQQDDEVRVAYVIWELLSQLEALLWDRYFEEFNAIMHEQEKKRGMELDFPWQPKKDC